VLTLTPESCYPPQNGQLHAEALGLLDRAIGQITPAQSFGEPGVVLYDCTVADLSAKYLLF